MYLLTILHIVYITGGILTEAFPFAFLHHCTVEPFIRVIPERRKVIIIIYIYLSDEWQSLSEKCVY